jgi:UDP-galactopyranose mutase
MRKPDSVVCFGLRRWTRDYDRAQHLMSQCAQERRAIYVEEPEYDVDGPDVEMAETRTGVITLIPHLPPGMTQADILRAQKRALDFALAYYDCYRPVLWYYDPRALAYAELVDAAALVYDWIDEETVVGQAHQQLLGIADLVFTDTRDHRQLVHHNVHPTDDARTWPELWSRMWQAVEQTVENTVVVESGDSKSLLDSAGWPSWSGRSLAR